MKKLLIFVVTILVLFLLMPFAQGSTQTNPVPQKNPGVYTIDEPYLNTDPFDPATNWGSSIQEVYEGLYGYNGNSASSYRPLLATNYTISPDGLNYTFSIRKNVTFTDGSPLNAYVFQYSIQRAILINYRFLISTLDQSIKNTSWIEGMRDVNITQANAFLANMDVHANSEYSLSIYLNKPSAAFISELIYPSAYAVSPSWIITHEPANYTTNQSDTEFGMVSLNSMFPQLDNTSIRKYLGLNDTTAFPNLDNSGIVPQGDPDSQAAYNYLSNHEIGTGPYMLQSVTTGVSIILERNSKWWNKANFHKSPDGKIDAPQTIIIKQVPDNGTRISNIKNDLADEAYIASSDLGDIMNPITHVPYINNVNVYTFPSASIGVLGFNMNNSITAPGLVQISQSNSGSGYSASYIKKHEIVKYTWKNSTGGTQYASPGNPFSALLFRKAFAYAWDYNGYINTILNGQANRLSGIIPEGLLGHQNNLISAGYIPNQNLNIAKTLFKEVNWKGTITIHVGSADMESWYTYHSLNTILGNLGVGITIKPVNFMPYPSSFVLLHWDGGSYYGDPSSFTIPLLHTGSAFPMLMNYSNPYVDTLMDKADAMTTNNTARSTLYRKMEINASGDYPYIYVYQWKNVAVLNRGVVDWQTSKAGNENPLYWIFGTHCEYVGLESYTPNTDTTTPNSSTATVTHTSPGFSLFSFLALITLYTGLGVRKKYNKDKKKNH